MLKNSEEKNKQMVMLEVLKHSPISLTQFSIGGNFNYKI